MRLVTWNLWWQFGPWEARQPAIVDELKRVDPDIVFCQEVYSVDGRDQAEDLAESLNLRMVRSCDADGNAHKFGNAILSRWPIAVLETIALPGHQGSPSYRNAVAAQVETPSGPQLMVVTHLSWQYNASVLRVAQLEAVVDLVYRHIAAVDSELPPIIAGDLNATPESDEIRKLTGRSAPYGSKTAGHGATPSVEDLMVFTDCWEAVGDGPGYTWSRDNPHADNALWPRRRLDYIFVGWPRAKPYANPVSAEIAGIEPSGSTKDATIVASDHYAVVVELDDRHTLVND